MFLPACQTPVNRKCRCRNKGRIFAEQKGNGLGYLIGLGQAVQGILLFHSLSLHVRMIAQLLFKHRRFDVTGADAVDPDLMRCRFQGQGLGKGHDSPFGRPIVGSGNISLQAGITADGYDTARPAA